MTFIVVLLLFLVAFTFLTCCLFSPIYKTPINATVIKENQGLFNEIPDEAKVSAENMTKITAAFLSAAGIPMKNMSETSNFTRQCRPGTKSQKQIESIRVSSPTQGDEEEEGVKKDVDYEAYYDEAGRLVLRKDPIRYATNREWTILPMMFSSLYFAMFAMGKPEVLPRVQNGPFWSEYLFLL